MDIDRQAHRLIHEPEGTFDPACRMCRADRLDACALTDWKAADIADSFDDRVAARRLRRLATKAQAEATELRYRD